MQDEYRASRTYYVEFLHCLDDRLGELFCGIHSCYSVRLVGVFFKAALWWTIIGKVWAKVDLFRFIPVRAIFDNLVDMLQISMPAADDRDVSRLWTVDRGGIHAAVGRFRCDDRCNIA